MTDMDDMWKALATHQPLADAYGYGKKWKRMCNEKTSIATHLAASAAGDTAWRADTYLVATDACVAALTAARDAAMAASWAIGATEVGEWEDAASAIDVALYQIAKANDASAYIKYCLEKNDVGSYIKHCLERT